MNNELFSIEEALMNNPEDQVKIEERKKLEQQALSFLDYFSVVTVGEARTYLRKKFAQ